MIRVSPARNLYQHRQSIRVLMFAAIAIVTAWSAFTSYSARPDDPGVTIDPQPEVSVVKPNTVEGDTRAAIDKTYGSLPLSFEVNRGQADASVKYVARGPGYNIFLTAAEAVFVLREGATGTSQRDAEDPEDRIGPHSRRGQAQSGQREAADTAKADPTVLRVRLKGANTNAGAVEGTEQLPGKVNYFIGNDSSKWLTDIPTYGKVVYRDAYPGIDMVYYGNRQQLEYDFVVAPGADASVVALSYEGAQDIRVDREGNLILKTKAGELRQLKPVIYQEIDGKRKLIEGRYQIRGKNRVGFRVSGYDRSKPLVIDPILVYSALVNAGGEAYAIAVDSNGYAYISGLTFNDFNPTAGVFQTDFSGDWCTFVTKVNQTGTGVVYSTYIGGNGQAGAWGIAVDAAGNAYITGYASGTFPTTPGAFQTTRASDIDCFITKLNAAGNAISYSTFYGGSEYDEGIQIAVDGAGNAYVTGDTSSRNLPTTASALQSANRGGFDGFVVRLNATGSALGYATYLGAGGADFSYSIAVDAANNAYVGGESSSLDFTQVNGLLGPNGVNRGFFRSTNSGGTWTLSNSGLLDSQVNAIAINPITTYIQYAATGGGVSRSMDGGVTWAPTALISLAGRSLAIDPTNTSSVYAGTSNGVYKTTNSGDSWTAVNNGLTNPIGTTNYPVVIRTLAIDPSNPTIIYAGGSGFYKSTNSGASWTRIGTGGTGLTAQNPQAIVIDPTNPSTIYVGMNTAGIFKSTNSGANWSAMNVGLATGNPRNIRSLVIDPSAPGTLYTGTLAGIFKTTNGATSWTAVNNGLLVPYTDAVSRLPTSVNALAINPITPTTLYAGSTNSAIATGAYPLTAILKSTDGGANWTPMTNGFGNLNNGILSLAVNGSDPSLVSAGTTADFDAFAAKINASGTSFTYSTLIGSSRNDYIAGIASDSTGNTYISGATGGVNLPITAGAFDSTLSGASDVFVMKLNASGTTRLYSTYLGGSSDDDFFGLAVDSAGNAHVMGLTNSLDFPVTAGAFQSTLGSRGSIGTTDAFVTKLNATGTATVYSSYLGGAGDELLFDFQGNNIALDPLGNAYVCGITSDPFSFPAFNFANAFTDTAGPGTTFVVKIESNTPSYSVTGRLTTAGNAPIGGVFVLAFNATFSRFTRTDPDGYYSIVGLPAGDYSVEPTRQATNGHFVYAPTARFFAGLNSNQTANFTGTQVFDITGRVTSQTVPGLGIFDVTMTLTGSSNAVVTTDAEGNFAFRDLVPGANYTVTPSKTGFAFSPGNIPFTNLSADMTANFETASGTFFFIGGHINDASSTPIPNVLVTMTVTSQNGSRIQTTQTNASGEYVFENLQAGGNYTITPSKTRHSFGPASLSFNNLSANQLTANFQGTELVTISGRVFNRAPDSSLLPVPGVQVTVTGSAPTTTDLNGQYSFNVPKGGNYTVIPVQTTSEPNYRYIPANRMFTNVVSDQQADFERLPFYRVSGRIADTKGVGVANVMLVLGVQQDPPPTGSGTLTTTTDSNGYYRFDFGNAGGSLFFNNGIAVYPSKPGYSFAPILYRTVAGVDIPGIRIPGIVHSNVPFAVVANFTPAHSISGRVTDSNGSLSGVTLTLSGGAAAVATSDANGNYSFLNVADGNDYTVTPSKTDLVFLPSNRTLINLSANQTGVDFSAQVFHAGFVPAALTADQVELKTWTLQGRTYAYVKLSFPNAGFRVANWGTAVRTGNDFIADAAVESSTGAPVQAVTTTAQIYDLGPLTNGSYNFIFKTSGVTAETLPFNITSTVPPPNPIDEARTFVKWQYRDFLNREPDQAGEDFWTDNITKCMDPARRPPNQTVEQCTTRQRETTSGAFFQSPEFQYTGYFVYRIYQGTLGRQAKLSEFIPDAQFVGNGIIANGQLSGAVINQNKAAFAAQFVNCVDPTKYRCAEFKAIYDTLTNQQFVDKLFQTTGVNASAADRAALVTGLNANPATETRASVVQKVVDGINVISEGNQQFTTTYGQAFYNAEFNRAFVQLEYFGYMKRDPDEAGHAFWLAKLNQFGGDFVAAEMVLAFISSPEYRARFGQP